MKAHTMPLDEYLPSSKKTVAISGCFDIIHIGHIRFIDAASKQGDELVILLESDEFIKTYKHRDPFHTQNERAEVLSHIKEVDKVVLLPFMTKEMEYTELWKKIQPCIIAVTEGDEYIELKRSQASEISAKVIEVTELYKGKSSTLALKTKPTRLDLS